MPEKKKYRVKVGMNYCPSKNKPEVRREAGEVVSDIPANSVEWLIEQGRIELVESRARSRTPPAETD